MKTALSLLILRFGLIVSQEDLGLCKGGHERFTECASSTCFEESCEDILFAKPGIKKCTKDCKRGCQCKPGFYRNHDGRCVDELTCILCGYGEDWKVIDIESDEQFVEETCGGEEIENPLDIEGKCVCGDNLYRREDGLCVTESTCGNCGLYEVFEECGSSSCWEYTCNDVLIPLGERLMRPCTLDCAKGCKCHPGFYRNEESGECVNAEMCL
jgi:hypothetical protein